jgi:hypothetical protein
MQYSVEIQEMITLKTLSESVTKYYNDLKFLDSELKTHQKNKPMVHLIRGLIRTTESQIEFIESQIDRLTSTIEVPEAMVFN